MSFSLRFTERKTLLIAGDLLLVNLTTLFALWLMAFRGDRSFDRPYLIDQSGWFLFLSGIWLFLAFLVGFYDPKRTANLADAARALLNIILLTVLIYSVIYVFFAPYGSLPRGVIAYQGVTSFFLIVLWRLLYVQVIQRPSFARRVIIVGAGWAGQTIAQAIHQYARAHYQIIGFVDDDPAKQGSVLGGSKSPGLRDSNKNTLSVLGTSCDLLRLVQGCQVPEIILAITHDLTTPLFQVLLDCKEQGVQITLMPVLYEQLTGQVPIEHIGDNWNIALPLDSAEASGFYPIFKRLFDIAGASIGLVLFALLFPFIALAIRLDCPGPILYRQVRVGKGGKVFDLLKLRTMIPGAEADGHAQHARKNDPRITRVGRWLRKMRLDEMPQLINVLRGDMSAVGPRPERPEHLAEFNRAIPFHRLRNSVKPGMAGWAVVNYDYVDSIADARIRLQYDLYYIKHQSLWLDFLILFRTMGHMLALRGR